MTTRLAAVSFGLAIGAAVYLLVRPVYTGSVTQGGGIAEPPVTYTYRATLLQVNGGWVVVPIVFPCAVALLPLLFRNQAVRILAAIVIGAFALIAGMSIGLFYVPAAMLMVLAARCRAAPAPGSR